MRKQEKMRNTKTGLPSPKEILSLLIVDLSELTVVILGINSRRDGC